MDSFGKAPGHTTPLIRDTIIKNNPSSSNNASIIKHHIHPVKDSFSLSQVEINHLIDTIKANNITDIHSIKDIATFKDVKGFNVNNLSDHQWSKLVAVVRSNIAENVAEVIYNTKNNEKLQGITTKERAHIDRILAKLRQSHITNINQAIEFVQQQSSNNPNLLSKLSGRLINIVKQNEQQLSLNNLTKDSFSPAVSIEAGKFSNPFKSDSTTRANQPRTSAEAREFLNQISAKNSSQTNINHQGNADLSNLIIANYLKGDKNAIATAEEMAKNNIKQLSNIDKMQIGDKVLHEKISYINDVAAKAATEKAKTIIICRLIGQVGGSIVGALGMATMVGASPLIGLLGAFALTLIAAVVGFILGKATGEMIGKVYTGTDLESMSPEEYEEVERQIELLKEESREKRRRQKAIEASSVEEIEDPDTSISEEPKDKNAFNYIDIKTSEALKSRAISTKN